VNCCRVLFGSTRGLLHRDFEQADILDGGPDDRQATGLRREHINLISALTYIAEQALNRIGRLNVSVHGGRKGLKAHEVIFILSQAALVRRRVKCDTAVSLLLLFVMER